MNYKNTASYFQLSLSSNGIRRRHEVFPYLPPPLPYVVLHYGVLALKAVLVPQPLKDALGRVALLLGDSQVIFIIWPMTR